MLNPELIEFDLNLIEGLSLSGEIIKVDEYYSVEVNKEFLLRPFATIKEAGFELPSHAAHISVIYPEETTKNKTFHTKAISFTVTGFGKMMINNKIYFALIVDSKSLSTFRQDLGLSLFPFYKGVEVPFHITVAKKVLTVEDHISCTNSL